MALNQIAAAYPEISPLIRDGDEALFSRLLGVSAPEISRWIRDRLAVRQLAGRAFRAVIDAKDPKMVVVATGEFAGGAFSPDRGVPHSSVVMGKILRDIIAPDASYVYLPNDGYRQPNLGVNSVELRRLTRGDFAPFTQRLRVLTEKAEQVVTYGASQGAATSMAFAAHPDVPVITAGAFDPSTVVRRSMVDIGRDFFGSGKQMANNIGLISFESTSGDPDELPFPNAYADAFTLQNDLRYIAGMVRPSALAIASLLRSPSFEEDAARVMDKKGGVVHLWTTQNNVSPDVANQDIADRLREHPTGMYETYRFAGEMADHSAIVVMPLGLLAMRHGFEQARTAT